MENGYMTTVAVAARLGCAYQTVIRMARNGLLKARKLDGKTASWLVREESVTAYEALMARTVGAGEAAEIARVKYSDVLGSLASGDLPGFKVGGRWRVERSILAGWTFTPKPRSDKRRVYPDAVVNRARALYAQGHGYLTVANLLDSEMGGKGPSFRTIHKWIKKEMRNAHH